MNTLPDGPFSAFVGIDWADRKHDVCVQGADEETREFDRIAHQPQAIEQWAQALFERFGGPIAIALELSKGPLVYALQKYDFFVLFPINPVMLAKYRQAFVPSQAKDDPTDAELALELLTRHPERLKPLQPQSANMRRLAYLVEQRRLLVRDRVRFTNRIGNALKQYYPQVLEWFDHYDTVVFCEFLTRWPTLKQVQRARASTLERFFWQHHVHRPALIKSRINAIKQAKALTNDDVVIEVHALQVLGLVEQIRVTLGALKRIDEVIAELAPKHLDYELFRALPGAGAVLAPRLLVAFGEDRERFADAAAVQKYAGIAPVTERSGNKSWVHWRWQCPMFVRQTFVEWAEKTVTRSYWAGLFYRQQRDKGKGHQAAVRALAFKWIRILYRCWKTHTPYDEATYLKALKRSGSRLLDAAM